VIGTPPARLAGRFGLAYLKGMLKPAHQGPLPQSATTARRPPGGVTFAIIVGSAVGVGAMLLGAAVLWIRYGTTVFFEMIATGLAACF
jgi:hypothetical protein